MLIVLFALALALAAPAQAGAQENFADEPPFGGQLPPPLVSPPSQTRPPPGFRLSPSEAIRIADRAAAVRDERAQSPGMRPVALERGSNWQVNYFTGSGTSRTEVAQAIVDDTTGELLGAWHDHQLFTPLARGYSGAIAQKVNAPYIWLPLCLLFIVPFLDPKRPFRLLHLDLLVLLGLGVSLFFFNRGEITTSVPLTYPVLGYVFGRMLWMGFRPRDGDGPLVPLVPIRWLAVAAVLLACGRIALNVVDSRVIDIGVAGVVGADHITHGQSLYNGGFAPGLGGIHGDVYGPFNYLAYVPFEVLFPWNGHWGDVPAAHAAAIAFDLLTAIGLVALGGRLRAGSAGRALGISLAFAWLAYPFTLYTMNANANDSLIAAAGVGAMLAVSSPPGRAVMLALGTAAKFGSAALAPLFATATGERRWRSALIFSAVFVVVCAVLVLPFLPDGGLREFYDRTLGYQASRSSPFSVWGLAPSLDFLRPVERGVAAGLALAVAWWPRRKSAIQVAALAAAVLIATQLGATHWFYFYVVWFLPFVLAALFATQPDRGVLGASRSASPAAPGSAS
ncbi:MAG: glycosyltransferase 87 family protein [Solirubrobacterales bacterium]